MTTNSSHKAMGWVHQATNWWGNKRDITGCRDRNNLQMPISSGNNGDGNDDETEPTLVSENFQITGLITPPERSLRTTLFLFDMAVYVDQEHEYIYSSAKNFAGLINSMEIDEL
jgi:hypothetical protein